MLSIYTPAPREARGIGDISVRVAVERATRKNSNY